jgi:peptidoglycan/xylan/chitin deacetylase (PgdA/CDA1 family)
VSRGTHTVNHRVELVLSKAGLGRIARALLVRRGRFVLMLHGVPSRHWPGVPLFSQAGVTAAQLSEILKWLSSRFNLLSAADFLQGRRSGVLLTFDDGLANNVTNALPVLEQYGAPAVFFITTQHVQQPRQWLPFTQKKAAAGWSRPEEVPEEVARDLFDGMSRQQVKQCAAHPLVTIGAHSVSHALLTRCDEANLKQELTASRRYLEELTGEQVTLFAYPTGDYDSRVISATRQAGYEAAFVVDSKQLGMPRFEIPRVGLYRSDAAYLDLKLSGLHRLPLRSRPLSGWEVSR